MCGITGIVNIRNPNPIDASVLRAMNQLIEHRGPDGDGFHFSPGVGFGHRRLSIIDLEGGKQPLYNEDHSVVVTYNGEIYNFQELEVELRQLGHIFRTRCDTEVIVHAWEEWGSSCLERFNGMFAFALWDENQQLLFLARDRLGVKPLFYAMTSTGELVFASELKSMMLHPSVGDSIDPCAVENYFTFGYIPDPHTIYTAVKKLEPGNYLILRRGHSSIESSCFWDVPLFEDSSLSMDEAEAKTVVLEELRRSTERRLISDVPLGAFLSGGIDSSAVVAIMAEIQEPQSPLTCSIGFKERKYDESRFARMVAQQYRTHHFEETVEASAYDLLDKLVGIYDEPYADSSAIPTYRVCQLARKHVTVALSGDAGDENFIGYRRYRLFAMEERLRGALPPSFRERIFGPLGKYYPKLDWAPRFLRGKTTFQALARPSAAAYLHGVSVLSNELRESIYSRKFKKDLQGYTSAQIYDHHLKDKNFEDPLRMVQYLDFKTYLPGDILTKVDRASMAVGLEVRSPFLDFKLVEAAARIPTKYKLKSGETKYILKKALENTLPREVLYRSKMGFAVPLDLWFRSSLKDRIRKTIQSERLKSCGYFDPKGLDTLWYEHSTGKRDHSSPLWSLLMFDGFLGSL